MDGAFTVSMDSPETYREPVYYGVYSFNTGKVKQLTPPDFLVVIGVLAISCGIASYQVWKEQRSFSLDDYLLAGRSMGPLPIGCSLLGSMISAVHLLGIPAEQYMYTTMYWWGGVGIFFMIAAAAHIYLPIFYHLHVTSVFEYLEMRFNRRVRTFAACVFYFHMLINLTMILFAPGVALSVVTNFTIRGGIAIVGVISTLYTALGGMRAVVWTEVFQTIMMLLSLFAIVIKASLVVGGIDIAMESGIRTERVWLTDFRMDPTVRHSVWSMMIGMVFTYLAAYGVSQVRIQKACTCLTLSVAQFAMWSNFIGLCLVIGLCCTIGLFMGAFYENCDPMQTKFATKLNHLMPLFAMDVLSDVHGLPGIFITGLCCGILSSVSTCLNAVAASFLHDVVLLYITDELTDDRAMRISQLITVVFGSMGVLAAVSMRHIYNFLEASAIIDGILGGPMLGLFSLGMFCPWANGLGAFTGFIVGMLVVLWLVIGNATVQPALKTARRFTYNCNRSVFSNATLEALDHHEPSMEYTRDFFFYLYSISYMWYGLLAAGICLTVGLSVSFYTGAVKPENLDPRLICPLCDYVFPFYYLPERIRKRLRFGIKHDMKYDKQETMEHYYTERKPPSPVPSTTVEEILEAKAESAEDEQASSRHMYSPVQVSGLTLAGATSRVTTALHDAFSRSTVSNRTK